jgi:hypothetical protein
MTIEVGEYRKENEKEKEHQAGRRDLNKPGRVEAPRAKTLIQGEPVALE